ncbi:uncharacterized mitochondrial protein AtMg00810-like [Miscanthus floridulus]|uniref:uncharacterized mitochondrial protein AtMg00810-like n=1 Tax=Miscanthus floridulus TaxID=154761 RepID=UPI00345AA95C
MAATEAVSSIPRSVRSAVKDPHWYAAMKKEYDSLQANKTWTLVPRPPGARIIIGKWVFKHKMNPDGTLECYKAWWVVRGFNQRPGIDFGETFSPVVKPATIRTVLTIVATYNWSAHQLDVSNAFLHGNLQEQASTTTLLRHIIVWLHDAFAVKDMGPVRHFLGINVQRTPTVFFLSQSSYVEDLLERADMANSADGKLIDDVTTYRSIAEALQYLTITCPDIAYAVQQVCLHMHVPRDVHQTMLKRILWYIKGTTTLGVQLRTASTPTITAYSNANWAGCPDTWRSTSGFCVFFGNSLVSWSSKRQNTVSRSSAEAEYRAIANAVLECSWLRHLLGELLCKVSSATVAYCDNISSVYMLAN